MTGPELQAIRRKLCGTNTTKFGRMLGYEGKDRSIAVSIRRLETMAKIPSQTAKHVADLLELFRKQKD